MLCFGVQAKIDPAIEAWIKATKTKFLSGPLSKKDVQEILDGVTDPKNINEQKQASTEDKEAVQNVLTMTGFLSKSVKDVKVDWKNSVNTDFCKEKFEIGEGEGENFKKIQPENSKEKHLRWKIFEYYRDHFKTDPIKKINKAEELLGVFLKYPEMEEKNYGWTYPEYIESTKSNQEISSDFNKEISYEDIYTIKAYPFHWLRNLYPGDTTQNILGNRLFPDKSWKCYGRGVAALLSLYWSDDKEVQDDPKSLGFSSNKEKKDNFKKRFKEDFSDYIVGFEDVTNENLYCFNSCKSGVFSDANHPFFIGTSSYLSSRYRFSYMGNAMTLSDEIRKPGEDLKHTDNLTDIQKLDVIEEAMTFFEAGGKTFIKPFTSYKTGSRSIGHYYIFIIQHDNNNFRCAVMDSLNCSKKDARFEKISDYLKRWLEARGYSNPVDFKFLKTFWYQQGSNTCGIVGAMNAEEILKKGGLFKEEVWNQNDNEKKDSQKEQEFARKIINYMNDLRYRENLEILKKNKTLKEKYDEAYKNFMKQFIQNNPDDQLLTPYTR